MRPGEQVAGAGEQVAGRGRNRSRGKTRTRNRNRFRNTLQHDVGLRMSGSSTEHLGPVPARRLCGGCCAGCQNGLHVADGICLHDGRSLPPLRECRSDVSEMTGSGTDHFCTVTARRMRGGWCAGRRGSLPEADRNPIAPRCEAHMKFSTDSTKWHDVDYFRSAMPTVNHNPSDRGTREGLLEVWGRKLACGIRLEPGGRQACDPPR